VEVAEHEHSGGELVAEAVAAVVLLAELFMVTELRGKEIMEEEMDVH
jgi:malonyl CoA-acyl carrier protein transacylase